MPSPAPLAAACGGELDLDTFAELVRWRRAHLEQYAHRPSAPRRHRAPHGRAAWRAMTVDQRRAHLDRIAADRVLDAFLDVKAQRASTRPPLQP